MQVSPRKVRWGPPRGPRTGGGPGLAPVANPGLAYVSRVDLTSLPDKQVPSLFLLSPSALVVTSG